MATDTDTVIRTHTMAVTKMLLGNRKMKPGVAICGGYPLEVAGRIKLGQMAKLSKTDVVHLEFGVTPTGTYGMIGIVVAVARGDACYVPNDCRLWLSKAGNRAVILPRAGCRGYFRLSPRELIHIDGKPGDDLAAGIDRADAWLARWVRADSPTPKSADFFEVPSAA